MTRPRSPAARPPRPRPGHRDRREPGAALYTRVLTLRQLPAWQYYAQLAPCNAAHALDDGAVLALAVVTLSRHKLQERGGRWLELASGLVMLGLAAVLAVQPSWLAG